MMSLYSQGGSTTSVTATWWCRDRRPIERRRVSRVLMHVGIVPDTTELGDLDVGLPV